MKENIRVAIVGLVGESLFVNGLTALLQRENDLLMLPPLHVSFLYPILLSLEQRAPDVVILLSARTEGQSSFFEEMVEEVSRRYRSLLITPLSVTEIKGRAIHILPTAASASELAQAIRALAVGSPTLQQRLARDLAREYHICFHEERLRVYAQHLRWTFQEKEVEIWPLLFYETEEIADRLLVTAQTTRRLISDRIYFFLSLLASKTVRDRATACRVSIEVGIYQVHQVIQQEEEGNLRETREPG